MFVVGNGSCVRRWRPSGEPGFPQLVGEIWSMWKVKLQALLKYKGLWLLSSRSLRRERSVSAAKALMILYNRDVFVKLIVGAHCSKGLGEFEAEL